MLSFFNYFLFLILFSPYSFASIAKPQPITARDIRFALRSHIAEKSKKEGGSFVMTDPMTGKNLKLRFARVRPVRKINETRFFACTDFYVPGKKEQIFDLDFWLTLKNGKLTIEPGQVQIHKHPQWNGKQWVVVPRFRYVNNEQVPLAVSNFKR